MKMMFPMAMGVALIAGLASSAYAPPVMAHFDCAGAYQQCVESGELAEECQLKENECWATNHWPDGYRQQIDSKHRSR